MQIGSLELPVAEALLVMDEFRKEDWMSEGADEVTVNSDGSLRIAAMQNKGSASVWYIPCIFGGDLAIAWQAAAVLPIGKNNLNFIFHATTNDGGDVLDTSSLRTGTYAEYHQLTNYLVTFCGTDDVGHSRVRRNPGFRLLSHADRIVQPNRVYNFLLVYRQGRILFYVDNECVHDVTDPEPLHRGRIAVRTWLTTLQIYKLAVYQLM